MVSGAINAFISIATDRIQCDGTTTRTRSFPDTAASMSLVGFILSDRVNPGKKTLFSR